MSQSKMALDVNGPAVAKSLVGGTLVGAGAMSAIELVRLLVAQQRDAAAAKDPTQTDKNTIVLTLPSKQAQATVNSTRSRLERFGAKAKITSPISKSVGPASKSQCRRLDGTMGKTAATTGWPTQTASVLAALGGGVGGAMLIDKVYAMARERKLRAELEAAQNEYVNLLSGQPKTAETIELLDMFDLRDPSTKAAAASDIGLLNYPISFMTLLTLLGSGSTAYLTKRVLDEKLRDSENVGMDIPKINRIVLKTQDGQAQDVPEKVAMAAVVLAVQARKGELGPLGDSDIKLACAGHGIRPESLLKQAQEDVSGLVNNVAKNYPDLMSLLQTKYTQANGGVMGWIANRFPSAFQHGLQLPGIKQLAARKTSTALSNLLPTKAAAAGRAPVGTMLASLIGADLMAPTAESIADKVVDKQNQEQERGTRVEPARMRVQAADPGAAEYLNKHSERVVELIRQLAAAGKV